MPPGLDQAFPAFVTLTNAITMICSLVLFEHPQFHYPQKPAKKNFYLFLSVQKCKQDLNTVFWSTRCLHAVAT